MLAVLVGLQASGKSTFARGLVARGYVAVSKDDFPRARRPQRRQVRLVGSALAAGHDVVVDNTNPSAQEWAPLVALARGHGARAEAYWFPPDPAASWARNAARAEPVPEIGLRAVLARLRRPTRDDGFDAVHTVTFDGAGGFVVARDEGVSDEEVSDGER